jgi:8-oxo-dGTP diphosphatase
VRDVSVAIVGCIDDDGRVLFVQQTGGAYAGAWVLPGGRVEPGERIEDAARRELREETGYAIADLRAVATYHVQGSAHTSPFLMTMFQGERVNGTGRAEHGGALQWCRPSEIELHPVVAIELADLGVIARDDARLSSDLARAGIEMRRIL